MNQVGRRHLVSNSSHAGPAPRIENLLLRTLSAEDLNRLEPHLEPLSLPVPFLLYEQAAPIAYAYFLNSGIGSLVSQFSDGGSVEIGIGGKEGFWGGALLAGVNSTPGRSFMQVSGDGVRVAAGVFVEHVRSSRAMEDLLNRALYLENVQSRQLAACNARHEVVERLARWLLMCDDRVHNGGMELTHEFLALMLGTRRSSVTVAAGTLQQAGLIRYTRRVIHIENRAELENAACQCYGIVAKEYERVIGFAPHDGRII
jgi:CRP-like cAMP-binding protein